MDKTRILGIAPYEGIKALMLQAAENRSDIELTAYVGDLNEGLSIASKFTLSDFDVIISRGGTAELLQDRCTIPIVEISLSPMDILRSIKLAHNVSNKYAIVGFPSITKSAYQLCDLLQYDIGIYTIHNKLEAEETLAELTHKGYYMILCDMITYSIAQTIGLTAILITSGIESIDIAFDKAVKTKKTHTLLTSQIDFFRTLLESNPYDVCVYNESQESIYSSKYASIPNIVKQEMQSKIPFVTEKKTLNLNKVVNGVLYVIVGVRKIFSNSIYTVFYVSSSKVPLSMIKDGIQYLNKDDVINMLFKSFYGITQPVLFSDSFVRKYADYGYPVMIIGEEGTGKEQLAYTLYSKSVFSSHPLIVINCIRFTSKSWSFLTEDSSSPLSNTLATIYFKNMELLSDQQFDELFSIIHDLKLYTKNRLIFTFSINKKDSHKKRYTQIINHFSCITAQVPALRDQVELIPDLASIYISNLNVSLAKEVLGFDADALNILKSYDWPGNYNQFKKIINELVMNTSSSYIKASAVSKLLKKENSTSHPNSDLMELSITDKTLEDINLDIIQRVLSEENGNQSSTAKRLGISRTTLWRMLQKISNSD